MVDRAPVENGCDGCRAAPENDENDDRGESGDGEEDVVDAARSLVEQELQRALTGLQRCQRVCPLDEEQVVRDMTLVDGDLSDFRGGEEGKKPDGDYEMSRDEFADLLNAVTEELEREGEVLSLRSVVIVRS